MDELNSQLGVALASGLTPKIAEQLAEVQNDLFRLGADLCVPETVEGSMDVPRMEHRHVERLEEWIDELSAELEPLRNFILPGGSAGASQLHLARTVCRRAERGTVRLGGMDEETVSEPVLAYLNRLSDLLFVMARYENRSRGVADVLWEAKR